MKISKRFVDQVAAAEKDAFYYDDGLTGFGVKVTKGGKKNFIVQTRIKGKVARFTIGEYGRPWSADQAREAAIQILADIVKGVDPRDAARANKDKATVRGLVEDYLERGALQKKATTLQFEAGLTKRHILPLLGDAAVAELTKADIQKFQRSVMAGKTAVDVRTGPRGRAIVTGGKGAANRSLALLSSILTFAVNEGHRTDNPAKGIKHFKLAKHDRYLSKDELKRLGKSLDDAELAGTSIYVLTAIRFMLLTGCRRNEALTLQWAWIDFDHSLAKLPDSKTGKKVLLLGTAALNLLTSLPKQEGSPLVFPSSAGGTTPISIQKSWDKIRRAAKLDDIRLHDLRHNFASSAVSAGQSE